ncbi:helicase POLQ-like isoform X2 [Anopheles funestus]|uniref:helicase POLQ-like isoform X2 n=1 Tax=Anopheles funestus TaxID=62324 RepID=UPI0020C72E62|nr:helicase POLQ-like isoform X2 [Anopheles funestus]
MSKSAPNRSFRVPAGPPVKARNGLQPLDLRCGPAIKTSPNVRPPVAVRTAKRKNETPNVQLEMDNTFLNAIDLDSIEQQIKPPAPRARSPSILPSRAALSQKKVTNQVKRSHSLEVKGKVAASTPKRRKSTAGGRPILVLHMSMEGEELEPDENVTSSRSTTKDSGCSERKTSTGFEDEEDEDYLLNVMIPCGQEQTTTDHFIRDKLRRLSDVQIGSQFCAEDNAFEVFTNRAIFSQYMRLDQSVLDEGLEQIDPIFGSQHLRVPASHTSPLSSSLRIGDDTQSHRLQVSEVQRIFANCERTLLDLTNIAPDGGSQAKCSSSLAAINWDEEIDHAGGPCAVAAPAAAAAGPPRVSSLFLEKGPFFGLPNAVRRILHDFRGIDDLYDWQRECLALPAIHERRNLIYALPTSGGKTLVAEILMLREIICRLRNVLFIVPYVSLAQEKMIALSPFALELQFLLEEYSGGKGQCPPRKRRKKNTIFVCTIEKSLMLMDSLVEAGRANEIGLIVIDELHMIGEERRGACLEMLITKVQVLRAGIQIVGMSATIGNLTEVARFMLADVYCRDFRPVELKEYVKCGEDLYEVRSQGQAGRTEDVFGAKRALEFASDCSEELRRLDTDHVVRLILEVIPESSCLVFCPTKSKCESLCALLAAHLPPRLAEHRADEKEQIIRALKEDGSVAPVLPQAFRVGVAYHHAGLTQDERRTIEDAYRAGILSLIVCTSTLAAGVNLPARRVIIRSPYIGNCFLTLSRYKQMVGRAGRAGFGETGDAILICAQRDIPQVCEMLCAPMDVAESALIAEDRAQFKSLILSAIGLDLCETREALQALVRCTLLAQQATRRAIDLEAITDETIVQLYQGNAIKARHDSCLRNPPNMLVEIGTGAVESERSQSKTASCVQYDSTAGPTFVRVHKAAAHPGKVIKTIERTSPLEVNRLGKAAIRAGFNMERAVRFYDEMKSLGEKLCVLDEYDLLHLILLEEGREVQFKMDDFIVLVNQLTNEQLKIAERYGINNGLIAKILTRRSMSGDTQSKMMRFIRLLIVYDLWKQTALQEVAQRYHINAGSLQTLMSSTAGTAYSLLRMCEEIPELWAFKHLLTGMTERLTHYCKLELLPLLELPSVKLGRARQLFRAGYTTLASIARAKSKELVETIEHLNYRTANQLILSAKAKLMEEVDALREQAEEYLSQLNR